MKRTLTLIVAAAVAATGLIAAPAQADDDISRLLGRLFGLHANHRGSGIRFVHKRYDDDDDDRRRGGWSDDDGNDDRDDRDDRDDDRDDGDDGDDD